MTIKNVFHFMILLLAKGDKNIINYVSSLEMCAYKYETMRG